MVSVYKATTDTSTMVSVYKHTTVFSPFVTDYKKPISPTYSMSMQQISVIQTIANT